MSQGLTACVRCKEGTLVSGLLLSSQELYRPRMAQANGIALEQMYFFLTNNGQRDYSVLKLHTPLEGQPSDCLRVTRGGKNIEYDVTQAQPTES